MSASNLAAIFTPNILRPAEESHSGTSTELELANHASSVTVVEILITHHDQIGIPPLDVSRIAQDFDEAKSKASYNKLIQPKPKGLWYVSWNNNPWNAPHSIDTLYFVYWLFAVVLYY